MQIRKKTTETMKYTVLKLKIVGDLNMAFKGFNKAMKYLNCIHTKHIFVSFLILGKTPDLCKSL